MRHRLSGRVSVAWLLIGIFSSSLLLSFIASFVQLVPAQAASQGKWLDQYNITYNGVTYTYGFNGSNNVGNINGNDMTLQAAQSDCTDNYAQKFYPTIDVNPYQTSQDIIVTTYLLSDPGTGAQCYPQPQSVKNALSNTYNSLTAGWPSDWSKLNYGWSSSPEAGKPTIVASDNGGKASFVQSNISPDGNTMTLNGPAYIGGPCNPSFDQITIGDSKTSYQDALKGTLVYQATPGSGNVCATKKITITLANSFNNTANASGQPPSGNTTPPTGNTTQSGGGCPTGDDTAIRWVLCPLFLLANKLLTTLSGIIQNLLYTPTDEIFGNSNTLKVVCDSSGKCTTSTNSGQASFQGTYNAFRNLGIGLLLVAGIIMVGAQAAGYEIFSPYMIRKSLPRIVFAIIGMVVAWPVLKVVVTFFNDLGVWIPQLILTASHVQNSGGNIGYDISGMIVFLLSAGSLLFIFVGWGILGFIWTAILAMLVGLIVIAIVKLGTIVLILTFPLAIACSVLPGTQKIWNMYREWLLGFLIAFPVIMAFLSAGQATSSISAAAAEAQRANGTGAGGVAYDLMAFIVLFVPYFLLGFIPKLIGGAFGTITGLVNDRHQGAFARAKKYRQGKTAENWHKFKEGERFRANNPLTSRITSRINKFGGGFGSFMGTEDKLGWITNNKQARDVAAATHGRIAAGEHAKKATTQAQQFNDNMHRAQTYASAAEARRGLKKDWNLGDAEIDKAITDAQITGGFGAPQQHYAVDQLAATGTGFRNMQDAIKTIARVSHGNKSMIADMVGSVRAKGEAAGRSDLKSDFSKMTALASQVADQHGDTHGMDDAFDDAISTAAMNIDNTTLLRNKSSSIENLVSALQNNLKRQMANASDQSLSDDQRARAAAHAGQIRAKLDNIGTAGQSGYSPEGAVQVYQDATRQDVTEKLSKSNTLTNAPVTVSVEAAQNGVRGEAEIQGQAGEFKISRRTTNVVMNGTGPQAPGEAPRKQMQASYQGVRQRTYPNPNDPRNQP